MGGLFYILPLKPLDARPKTYAKDVAILARLTKYKTRLTENKRVILEKEASMNYPGETFIIKSPEDVAILGRDYMRIHEQPEEHLYMICMNTKNRVLGVFEISHGTVNSSIVGVREIYQKALLANSVSIILMHNHPSGSPDPSREDIIVTVKVAEAGKLLGVELLDHIIIGDNYVSLKEKDHIR